MTKTELLYNNKLINLVIADALQLDSMKDLADFAASLLIQGVESLTDMSIADLEREVYDRWSYTFDVGQSELFADNNEAFKAWVMSKQIQEYYVAR